MEIGKLHYSHRLQCGSKPQWLELQLTDGEYQWVQLGLVAEMEKEKGGLPSLWWPFSRQWRRAVG
jgi:hypothetical protein